MSDSDGWPVRFAVSAKVTLVMQRAKKCTRAESFELDELLFSGPGTLVDGSLKVAGHRGCVSAMTGFQKPPYATPSTP
jgi:hypothetical protein